jgi:hypothetical protein
MCPTLLIPEPHSRTTSGIMASPNPIRGRPSSRRPESPVSTVSSLSFGLPPGRPSLMTLLGFTYLLSDALIEPGTAQDADRELIRSNIKALNVFGNQPEVGSPCLCVSLSMSQRSSGPRYWTRLSVLRYAHRLYTPCGLTVATGWRERGACAARRAPRHILCAYQRQSRSVPPPDR